jgi:hypothetical protein
LTFVGSCVRLGDLELKEGINVVTPCHRKVVAATAARTAS